MIVLDVLAAFWRPEIFTNDHVTKNPTSPQENLPGHHKILILRSKSQSKNTGRIETMDEIERIPSPTVMNAKNLINPTSVCSIFHVDTHSVSMFTITPCELFTVF